jgi:hypothetical protein
MIFRSLVLYLSIGLMGRGGEHMRDLVRSFHKSTICVYLTVCVLYMMGHYIW